VKEGDIVWCRARLKASSPGKVKVWILGKFDQELVVMDPADVRTDPSPGSTPAPPPAAAG
jgi:hypothetical protein